ncbi:MAG: hypothetical protein IIA72_07760 [Proteobacteria bacterium]|nr:hypothetical protein [Pseudomonadota bacterium]
MARSSNRGRMYIGPAGGWQGVLRGLIAGLSSSSRPNHGLHGHRLCHRAMGNVSVGKPGEPTPHVRFLADHVRFTPNGGHWRRVIGTSACDPLRTLGAQKNTVAAETVAVYFFFRFTKATLNRTGIDE